MGGVGGGGDHIWEAPSCPRPLALRVGPRRRHRAELGERRPHAEGGIGAFFAGLRARLLGGNSTLYI